MIRFVAGRLLQGMLVVLAVATLTFALLHLAPGSPLTGGDYSRYVDKETLDQAIRNFGLDKPIHIQYINYLSQLLRGDFGTSFSRHQPVLDVIAGAAPNTLILALAACLVDFTLGIGLGIIQAVRAGSSLDHAISGFTLAFYSTPVFLLGFLALLLFGQVLGWLPVGGVHDSIALPYLTPVERFVDLLRHLLLPAAVLGIVGSASTARYQRAALLDVMQLDYIRTARAKGLRERRTWLQHGVPNALLPIITLGGLSLPILLSGAVLIETIFSWPGMGLLSTRGILSRDFPLVTGTAIVSALVVVTGNLAADVAYRFADPRIRRHS